MLTLRRRAAAAPRDLPLAWEPQGESPPPTTQPTSLTAPTPPTPIPTPTPRRNANEHSRDRRPNRSNLHAPRGCQNPQDNPSNGFRPNRQRRPARDSAGAAHDADFPRRPGSPHDAPPNRMHGTLGSHRARSGSATRTRARLRAWQNTKL